MINTWLHSEQLLRSLHTIALHHRGIDSAQSGQHRLRRANSLYFTLKPDNTKNLQAVQLRALLHAINSQKSSYFSDSQLSDSLYYCFTLKPDNARNLQAVQPRALLQAINSKNFLSYFSGSHLSDSLDCRTPADSRRKRRMVLPPQNQWTSSKKERKWHCVRQYHISYLFCRHGYARLCLSSSTHLLKRGTSTLSKAKIWSLCEAL